MIKMIECSRDEDLLNINCKISNDCFKKDIVYHKASCEADIGNKTDFLINFENA